MTVPEIKAVLEEVSTAERRYNLACEKTQHYNEIISSPKTSVCSDTPKTEHTGNSSENKIITALANEEYERECLSQLLTARTRAERLIGSIVSPVEKEVLTRRYILCQRWETIAEEMHYHIRYIHKIHKRALQNRALNGTINL